MLKNEGKIKTHLKIIFSILNINLKVIEIKRPEFLVSIWQVSSQTSHVVVLLSFQEQQEFQQKGF